MFHVGFITCLALFSGPIAGAFGHRQLGRRPDAWYEEQERQKQLAIAAGGGADLVPATSIPQRPRHPPPPPVTATWPPPDSPSYWYKGEYRGSYRHPPGKCDELPPPRIWSHSSQVPHGGNIGPLTPPPKMTIMTRTFHGLRQVDRISKSLICMFTMVPANEVDIIFVLDEGPMGEIMARCLLEIAEKFKFPSFRVALDQFPAMEKAMHNSMFAGALEGPEGKDRSQYANFIADRYTYAPVIGMFDAEVCFQSPMIPGYIRRPESVSGVEKLHNTIEAGGSSWGVDNRILGVTTVIDVMWPDRMPIWFWREDLKAVRDHMTNKWGGPDKCFDEAFANMTHGGNAAVLRELTQVFMFIIHATLCCPGRCRWWKGLHSSLRRRAKTSMGVLAVQYYCELLILLAASQVHVARRHS